MDVCPPEGIITLPEWRHLLMDCPPELCSLWGIFYPLCSCDSLIWRPLCSSSYSTENGLVKKKKVGIKMSFGEQSFLRKLRHPFQNIFKVFFLLLQFDLLWNNRFSLLIYFFFNLSLIVVEFKLKWYFFVVPKNFTLYLSLRKKKKTVSSTFYLMWMQIYIVSFSPLLLSGNVLGLVYYTKFWLNLGSKLA